MYNAEDASVAQWIEQCPPEACAQVRLLSDAFFMSGFMIFLGRKSRFREKHLHFAGAFVIITKVTVQHPLNCFEFIQRALYAALLNR